MNKSCLAGCILTLFLVCVSWAHPKASARPIGGAVEFDIPAQPLSSALLLFSEQSHLNVIASSSLVDAYASNPVQGTYHPLEALHQLLEATDLLFDITPAGMIVILAPTRVRPIPPATESLPPRDLIEETRVTGIRLSLASALGAKRMSDAITDGISEEDVGKFPDANVVESLQRMTGVSIARGRAGEGQFINVRGLGQQFNLVTLNGRILATDNTGREFSFDVLPSELISGARIYKTPVASRVEGSIGGTVNLTSARALDRPGSHGSVSTSGLYDDMSEKWGGKLSGTVSHTFADDRMGVVLGGSYSKRHWRADMAQSLGFGFEDIDLNQDGVIDPDSETNLHRPGYLAYPLKMGERERLGVVAGYQFQASDQILTGLDFLYTSYSTPEIATYQTNNFFTPEFRPGSVEVDKNGTVTHFIIDDYVTEVATDPKNREVETWQLGWNAQWQVSPLLNMALDLSYSEADRPEGGKTKFWVAGIPNASAEFNAGDPVPSLRVTLADGRDISEATNDEVRVGFMESQGDDIHDSVGGAKFDGALEIRHGFLSSLDFGISYLQRSKERNATTNDACSYCGFPFSFGDLQMQGIIDFPVDNFLEGEAGEFPTAWPNIDAGAIFALLQAADGTLINPNTDLPYEAGYSNQLIPRPHPEKSSLIEEQSASSYLQINLEGKKWFGNVGARLSRTSVNSSGETQTVTSIQPIPGTPNTQLRFADPREVTVKSHYVNFLPSINLAFELDDEVLLRFAAAETMSRPSISRLGLDVTYETNQGIRRKSYNGNPELKPVEATQYDSSLEWYISDASLFNLAIFYKDISGYVSDTRAFEDILGETFAIVKPVNQERVKVHGAEIALQHLFDNGLGFQVNYTRAQSRLDGTSPDILPNSQLENFSEYSYNLIGIYERGPVSARVAINYRDHYILTSVGQGGRPETADSYAQMDFRTSYRFADNASVYVEGLNLTGESAHVYSEFKNRLIEYEQVARRFSLGVRLSF